MKDDSDFKVVRGPLLGYALAMVALLILLSA